MYNFGGKVVFATGAAVLADCGRNVMFDKIHGDYGKYD